MSNAVMLSIRPNWCEKIINSDKTIEVRKTRPKLDTPFKCYIYCTIGGQDLNIPISQERLMRDYLETGSMKSLICPLGNGKVIGEFTCDAITRVNICGFWDDSGKQLDNRLKETCLTSEGLCNYLGTQVGYGWHISDLKIYDTPRELGEFWFPPELYCEKELCGGCPCDQVADVNGEYSYDCEWRRPLSRAPQSWCYVEEG